MTYEYKVEQVHVGYNGAAEQVFNAEAKLGWRVVSVVWRPTDNAPTVVYEREVAG